MTVRDSSVFFVGCDQLATRKVAAATGPDGQRRHTRMRFELLKTRTRRIVVCLARRQYRLYNSRYSGELVTPYRDHITYES